MGRRCVDMTTLLKQPLRTAAMRREFQSAAGVKPNIAAATYGNMPGNEGVQNMNNVKEIAVAIFASTGFWAFCQFLVQRYFDRKSAVKAALLGLLHERLVEQCEMYLNRGYASEGEIRDLEEYIYTPSNSQTSNTNSEVKVNDFNVNISGTIRLDGGNNSQNIDVKNLLNDVSFISALKDIIKESMASDINGGRVMHDVSYLRGMPSQSTTLGRMPA